MTTTHAPGRNAAGTMFSRPLTTALCLLGPVASVLVVLHLAGGSLIRLDQVSVVLKVALVFWSPVFFSIPALLLQDARDAALPQMRGVVGSLVRGVVLVPWMLLSPRSTARLESAAALVGFVVAVAAAWGHLAW